MTFKLLEIHRNKEKNSEYISFGVLVLLFTVFNDIVFLNIWVNDYNYGPKIISTIFGRGELTPYGQFAFAISNSLLLAKNSAETFKNEELMIKKLQEINRNLDNIVKERTKALEKSTEKINEQNIALEEKNKELNFLSFNDPLTGLWNRRKYENLMTEKWDKCRKNKKPISLVFIDIDNFKKYNDTYGHISGDKALVKVATTIKKSFSHLTNIVSRYGGEEFVVLLYDIDKNKMMDSVVNVVKEIEELKIFNEKSEVSRYLTVSVGAAYIVPTKDDLYADLFKLADKALYMSKIKGKNQANFA